MLDFLFSPVAPLLAAIIGIIIWIIRDQNNRKKRETLTQEIKNSKVEAVYVDTKSTRKASSFAGFSVQWENAEVIFTDRSVLYFSYVPLFGYRLYTFIKHWYIPGAKVPAKLSKSSPIEDIEIKGQDLVIISSLKFSEVTNTLKNVVDSEKFETIKKMLGLSPIDNQED